MKELKDEEIIADIEDKYGPIDFYTRKNTNFPFTLVNKDEPLVTSTFMEDNPMIDWQYHLTRRPNNSWMA